MVELFEYCLVFLVSALFVAGSVATYDSFSGFASGLQFKAASASIARLADEAVSSGSATGEVAVPASTLRCEGGVLTLASGNMTEQHWVPAACDFVLGVQGGVRSFGFRYQGQLLTISVS
jgi:hypothetical protein